MKRIVILLLVITGLYIIFNQTFHFEGFAFAGNKDGKADITNNINTIAVNVGGVSTTIIPEDRDDVKAVLTGKGTLRVKDLGDTIEVSMKRKWFNDWFSFSKKKELKIYIPEDYNRDMEINLGSGNLNFSGQSMKLDELSVDIGSGNLNLKDLEVNEFEHDVSSGNVTIDSLTTKTGAFDISSGNLDIKHYTGAIEADVSSGRFQIQLDKLTDSIEMDLSSGNIRLDLPDNADFELIGDVSSGNISSDFPLTSKVTDKKSINGTHGNGKYKITIDVSSGNVEIN
jgi:lia operon protein LiaG